MPNNKINQAWMSKKLKNGLIKCLACNHYCQISENKAGICGARHNKNNELILLTYSKAIAVHTDPVEKKPLFHFYPNEPIFSFGTAGCNFRCKFCQNWDISQYKAKEGDKLGMDLPPQKAVDYCKDNNISMIAYTYNEPTIFFEYAYDTCQLAHQNGIKNVIVSNGYTSDEAWEKWSPHLDAANIDLKGFTEDFYQDFCGAKLASVKKNIQKIAKSNVWLELTTLLITDANDSEKEIQEMADFIGNINPEIPWHLSRYFPNYLYNAPPTPIKTLEKAYEIAKKVGLKHVYLGNVGDIKRESTYCAKCGKILIERDNYQIENYLKNKNKCPECGEILPGFF